MIPLDRSLVRVGLALGLLALTALPAAASHDESYGYFRVIEGSATLMQAGGDRQPAEINQPVLAGDRVWVPSRSRVEIVLADRNLLRLDGGSEITLEQLSASPDRNDPATVLRLHEGNLLLTVTTDSYGDQLPRVETPNATIYTQHFGTYRVTTSQDSWTEVTVRRGKAEVVTDRGSEIVSADETAYVEGDRYAKIDVDAASSYDSLERWAERLDDDGRYAGNDYIEEDLRYQAAPLDRYGSWTQIGGRSYWRPRVDAGWRPYWQGRWAYTPAGLTWISYEPWGWVPYHYGSWDYLDHYGWLWSPGYHWAPAWVYWYWGPSYVGWCPTGYYTSFYRHRYPYFRYGIYGWAGGDWGSWSHWSFIRHDYFHGYGDGYRNGRRDHWDVRRYAVPTDELRRQGRPLDPGVVTTDTRPLKPDTWDEPRHAIAILTDERNGGRGAEGGLPDVTPFIQRKPDLPPTVVRTVVPEDGNQPGGGPRVAERPRNPGNTAPWDGGAMPTDPSGRRGAEQPRLGGAGPQGETPRVRTPREGFGGSPGVEAREPEGRRVGRPEPGERGGAPRPEAGSEPRVRVQERQDRPRDESPADDDRDDQVRSRRPEAGTPGGAPRPSRPEVQEQPADQDRGRGQRDREIEREAPRGYDRPQNDDPPPAREREREPEAEAPRHYDPPPSRDREQDDSPSREREPEAEAPQHYDPPPSRDRERDDPPPPSRERARAREASPPSYSRPSRPEPAPSRPERREEARPSEPRGGGSEGRSAERSRGNEDHGGRSSRGSSGGDRSSSSSRGSRSRPPG